MTDSLETNSRRERFKHILELQTRVLKLFEATSMDDLKLQDCRNVLAFLKSLTDDEIRRALEDETGQKKARKREVPQISDEELGAMNSSEISNLLNKDGIPRKLLERLASKRFAVTKGALSTFRSNEALLDKLRTLLANEQAHESISRAASSGTESFDTPSDKKSSS